MEHAGPAAMQARLEVVGRIHRAWGLCSPACTLERPGLSGMAECMPAVARLDS
jgi:hypothetical protein